MTRRVGVKSLKNAMRMMAMPFIVALSAVPSTNSEAATIFVDFEGLGTTLGTYNGIVAPGVNLTGINHGLRLTPYSEIATAPHGATILQLNGGGDLARFDLPFFATGVTLEIAATNSASASVAILGYNGINLVGSAVATPSVLDQYMTYSLSCGILGCDNVRLIPSGSSSNRSAIDGITFTELAVSTPEPSSMVIFGASVLGLFAARRRQIKN